MKVHQLIDHQSTGHTPVGHEITYVSSKQKTNHILLLPLVLQWFLYPRKKNIKPIITLRRLVGNRASLS